MDSIAALSVGVPARDMEEKKLMALWYLSLIIEAGQKYTEAEINGLPDEHTTFLDPAALRRELYNKHLLDRTADCRLYWKEQGKTSVEDFLTQYTWLVILLSALFLQIALTGAPKSPLHFLISISSNDISDSCAFRIRIGLYFHNRTPILIRWLSLWVSSFLF